MFAKGDMLVRHCEGDRSAFCELVQQYRKQVYSYLIRCGVPAGERDDLFQEVFLKIHRAAHTYQKSKPFEPWFYRIVCNTVRSFFRKKSLSVVSDTADADLEDSRQESLDSIVEAKETSVWLEHAIQQLPFNQRETLVLCCLKSLSQQDAAMALDMPLNTLKTNLRRARAALAEGLTRRNLSQQREAC